jgi:hypothetical protein
MGNEVKLIRMTCQQTEDEGEDELYLLYGGGKVWEGSMNVGWNATLNITRPIVGEAYIDLFDEDWPDSDDYLGRITVRESEVDQGERTQTFTRDDAHYTLHYKVREE